MEQISQKRTHITVIIPVYNCEKYVEEAVYSVLNQPYKGIEIVLVDDGSTDSSPRICDQLAEKEQRIHVIHKENGGVSSARNVGIEYVLNSRAGCSAEETYVAFLDSDDCWDKEFLNDGIVKLLYDGFDLLGFQSYICDEYMQPTVEPHQMKQGAFSGGAENVWNHSGEHFGAMLYSARLLHQCHLRFREGLKFSEDRIFSMQCMYLADSVCLLNRQMYGYRQHQGSAIHNRSYGISHFVPIIDMWMESDAQMAPYANEKRGVLREGRTLARLYIMDMMDEHYQIWGKREELEAFMESRSDYMELLQSSVGPSVLTERYNWMMKHPVAHRVKNRLAGAAIIARTIYHKFIG